MNIPSSIHSQMLSGLGSQIDRSAIPLSKVEGAESFDSIYNLGLNSLKSAVSPSPKATELSGPASVDAVAGGDFGLTSFIREVDAKSKEANAIRADAMSGGSSSLHHAMIASQEAGVSFSLLVEMRNKLLETYQELMRMQI